MLFSNQNSNKDKFNNFKTQLLYQLIKLRADQQQGTVITVTVVLGLLMLVLGFISISTANGTKNNVISEQGTNQSKSVAEAGVNKSLAVFNQGNNEYMLLADYDGTTNTWTAPSATDLDFDGDGDFEDDIAAPANTCGDIDGDGDSEIVADALEFIQGLVNGNNENNTIINEIQSSTIGNGDSKGAYFVVDYNFTKALEQGTLKMRGVNSNNNKNQAQYEVTFDVNVQKQTSTTVSGSNAAALMGQDVDVVGTNIYASTAICTNPSVTGNCGNDIDWSNIDGLPGTADNTETAASVDFCDDGTLNVDLTANVSSLTGEELGEYSMLAGLFGAKTSDTDSDGLLEPNATQFKSPNNKTVANMIVNPTTIPDMPVAPSGTTIITVNASTGNVGSITASLYDPSSTVAVNNSVSENSETSEDHNWTTLFSSTFKQFWQWLDAPAYAGNGNGNGNTSSGSGSTSNGNGNTSSGSGSSGSGSTSNGNNFSNTKNQTITAINKIIGTTNDNQIQSIQESIAIINSQITILQGYKTTYPTNAIIAQALTDAQNALTDANISLTTAQTQLTNATNATTATQLTTAQTDATTALNNAISHATKASTAVATAETEIASLGTGTTAGSGGTFNGVIDVSASPYKNAWVADPVLGSSGYDAIYIQLSNASSVNDIRVVIDDAALGNINSPSRSGEKIDPERIIIRLYIAENYTANGNSQIAVVTPDGSGGYDRIDGDTESERKKIASLRIIGANADGTALTDQNGATEGKITWDLSGTGCLMGQIHATETVLSLPQGNGCGNAGGETPINLNNVMNSEYGSGNYTSFSGGASSSSPNLFGAAWALKVTNGSSGGSGIFYENRSLTSTLALEFGNGNNQILGAGTGNVYVHLGDGLTSITRKGIN